MLNKESEVSNMAVPTTKIINFGEMLITLMALSRLPYRDIHTISIEEQKYGELFTHTADPKLNRFGCVYDSMNSNQIVAYACIKQQTGLEIADYFGNYGTVSRQTVPTEKDNAVHGIFEYHHRKSNGNFKLDGVVRVKVYFPVREDPYIEVQVTGSGLYQRYVIQNGKCEFKGHN